MSKLSLLIVDPDAYYAGIYANRFEAAGWNVGVAESIADARKALKKRVPNAMMLDGAMEEAITFIHEMREESETAEMKLVVVNEPEDKEHIEQAKEAGIDGYYFKGHFFPSQAIAKMRRIVTGK